MVQKRPSTLTPRSCLITLKGLFRIPMISIPLLLFASHVLLAEDLAISVQYVRAQTMGTTKCMLQRFHDDMSLYVRTSQVSPKHTRTIMIKIKKVVGSRKISLSVSSGIPFLCFSSTLSTPSNPFCKLRTVQHSTLHRSAFSISSLTINPRFSPASYILTKNSMFIAATRRIYLVGHFLILLRLTSLNCYGMNTLAARCQDRCNLKLVAAIHPPRSPLHKYRSSMQSRCPTSMISFKPMAEMHPTMMLMQDDRCG